MERNCCTEEGTFAAEKLQILDQEVVSWHIRRSHFRMCDKSSAAAFIDIIFSLLSLSRIISTSRVGSSEHA